MNDNQDTPEDLDRQLESARKALQDFEDNVDWARLMLRLRTASPAHPLLLIRFLFGALATICVLAAIILLVTTLLSPEVARALAKFETVIPLPEQIPALPTVLGVIALFLGVAWATASAAGLALGRDAPMLPWEQKQHQKLFNEVTRLTTQKAVMERIKNTPAGARPRIATPVPVANRRSTPMRPTPMGTPAASTGSSATGTPAPSAGSSATLGSITPRQQAGRSPPSMSGYTPTPQQIKSATPTPVSRSMGGFGARGALPSATTPGRKGTPRPMPSLSPNPPQLSPNPPQLSPNPPQLSPNPPQLSPNPPQPSPSPPRQTGSKPPAPQSAGPQPSGSALGRVTLTPKSSPPTRTVSETQETARTAKRVDSLPPTRAERTERTESIRTEAIRTGSPAADGVGQRFDSRGEPVTRPLGTPRSEVAQRDSFASSRPLPSNRGATSPSGAAPLPGATVGKPSGRSQIGGPQIVGASSQAVGRETETPSSARTPVDPNPPASRGWAARVSQTVSDGVDEVARTAPVEVAVEWDETTDTGLMEIPREPTGEAVVLDVEAPPAETQPRTSTRVSPRTSPSAATPRSLERAAGARPSIVMPTAPVEASNGTHARVGENGGVRLGVEGVRTEPVRRPRPGAEQQEPVQIEDDETIEDGAPPRSPDGILGRVRSGGLPVGRPTPYGSAGRVRLPPPAATVRLGAVEAALGQSTRGGTPLGAPPKAGIPVGQAKPRSTPSGVERSRVPDSVAPTIESTPRATRPGAVMSVSALEARQRQGAFPSTPDPGDRVAGDGRSMFSTPPPLARGTSPGATLEPMEDVVVEDDLEVPTVVPTRKNPHPAPPPATSSHPTASHPTASHPTAPRTLLAPASSEPRTLPMLVASADDWMVDAVDRAQALHRTFPPQAEIALSVRDDVPFTLRLTRASPAIAVRAVVNFVEFLAAIPTPPLALLAMDTQLDRSFHKNVEAALEPYFKGQVRVTSEAGGIELRFSEPDMRWNGWRRLPLV